jgi:hypothetical protein
MWKVPFSTTFLEAGTLDEIIKRMRIERQSSLTPGDLELLRFILAKEIVNIEETIKNNPDDIEENKERQMYVTRIDVIHQKIVTRLVTSSWSWTGSPVG